MENIPNHMIAVILSGGKSSRMGQDKGLIQEDGLAWTQSLQQKLEKAGLSVYVSINELQQASYSAIFSSQSLILDHPSSAHINGPLKGILSAHLQFPEQSILFLPCDMPLIDQEAIQWLLNHFSAENTEQPLICATPDHLQPLCGIYGQAALNNLKELYEEQVLIDQSMHAIVEKMLNAHILSIPAELLPQFKNFNTPDDLKS